MNSLTNALNVLRNEKKQLNDRIEDSELLEDDGVEIDENNLIELKCQLTSIELAIQILEKH